MKSKNKIINNKPKSQHVKIPGDGELSGFSRWKFSLIPVKLVRFYPVLLIFIVSVIYFRSFSSGVVYCDDHEIIHGNFDRINSLGKIPEELFKGYMNTDYYRPLINLSFIFDAVAGGQDYFIYHLTNIILHIICCCLLFILLKKFGFDDLISSFLGLIFAVHPLLVNAVSWIPGRNDIVYAMFLIISMIFFISFDEKRKKVDLIFHFLCFLLALLSKENSLIFPFNILIYIFFFKRSNFNLKQTGILISGWAFCILVWLLMRNLSTLGKPVYSSGFYLFDNIAAIPEFIAKFILPLDLSVLPAFSNFNTLTGLVIILTFFITIIFNKKFINRMMVFGLFWFIIGVLPGLFVQNLDARDWNDYLECRAYFPVIGLLIIAGQIISSKFSSGSRRAIMLSIVVVLLSVLTIIETGNYTDPLAFYRSAVATHPQKARYHSVLARLYLQQNQADSAEKEYKAAINSNPRYGLYYYDLGSLYYRKEQFSLAADNFKNAMNLGYMIDKILEPLAMAYRKEGKYDSAVSVIERALVRSPDSTIYYSFLIELYTLSGNEDKIDSVENILKTVYSQREELTQFYNYSAENLLRESRYKEASILLNKVLRIAENDTTALYNLLSYNLYILKDINKSKYLAQRLKKNGFKLNSELEKKLGIE